jgi:hypothetical protein
MAEIAIDSRYSIEILSLPQIGTGRIVASQPATRCKELGMKNLGVTFAALCLASTALAGCQAEGHEKAETKAVQMDSLRASVLVVKDKAAAAAAAAGTLIDKASVDPKPAYATFKTEIKNYEKSISDVAAQVKSLKSQDTDFFAGWEKQTAAITDPDVKQRAVERRAKLQKTAESIDKSAEAVTAETTAYSAMLKNLDVYWSNDLTPGGITSVKDKVGDAKKSAKSIGDKCDDLVAGLDKAAPDFRTAKPPPPAPEGGKPAETKKN